MSAVAWPRVKICCIADPAEMWLAVRAGASAVGLVSAMPSGPGPIAETMIAEVAALVPPGVASFLLTSLQSTDAIIAQQRRLRPNTIQIVDHLAEGTYEAIRDALPGVGLVQVIHVGGEESIREAEQVAAFVDAVLLDSGNQKLAVKELGGTGRRHDWTISRSIREKIDKPIYLAGGLNAGNVREAVETVGPFGLDVCSGVRSGGRLDPEKLAAFFDAVRLTSGITG